MSLVLSSPNPDNSVYVHIAQHRPRFLLSPPPPPKHKRALAAAKLPHPPTPPYSKRAHTVPRSPLSPLESFLNLLDTPSPPTTVNKKRDLPFTLNDLGYNFTIETFYTSFPAATNNTVPVTPRPVAAQKQKKAITTPAKPLPSTKPLFGMNLLSRQQTHSSKPSSSSKLMPLHSRSNQGYESSTQMLPPPMPDYNQQRRGSLPTSSSQNHPRSTSTSSSSKLSSSRNDKDINKAQNKRYPLPLPYAAVVEMDQILGDNRSAQKVLSNAPNSYARGATAVGPRGEVSTGRPYVGADGRVWRDREEELEYAGLLASPEAYRRGSDDTTHSIEDEAGGERQGRRAWAKFGVPNSAAAAAAAAAKQKTTYDRFQASEHRLRMPHSATSSSSDTDEEGGDEPWSPLVETHAAQHQFPSYVFPGSSKSSRASSSTVATTTSGRAMPLPVSINDFAVPHRGAPQVHHVPRAKEDFLASAFAPAPSSSSSARREQRERERAAASSRPPTSESRMTARRSSVQGVGRSEIVVPLPSLMPSSTASSHRAPPPQVPAGKERSGFLGVFKKK